MANQYTPRRAGKRWRENAPDYILDCFDNRGTTADRYIVMFTGDTLITDGTCAGTYIAYLGMSDAPTHPQGVSMWGEMSAYAAAGFRYDYGHNRVRWLDLPEHIRQHVIARVDDC